ncbi:unnamed protein product [Symbiodinium natans]|uniref:Ubiquitin-like domain-containing protein n=1 Tax=Symbiodinium natans TaxID=878477 RepID=A0A812V2V1_9DINO|nr:unnamed protein product [Symbiodinium natans]
MTSRGTVRICTPGGNELAVPFSEEQTVAQLKVQLEQQLAASLKMETPAVFLRLLHGAEELKDEWLLVEHGVADGTLLTQIVSPHPSGVFKLRSDGLRGGLRGGPAGRNTTATIHAEFREDGTFHISVKETEITSLVRLADWDPHREGAAFDHEYEGKTSSWSPPRFILSVSRCERKGKFVDAEPVELTGEICPDAGEVQLQLPFAAGACNEGRAGLRWVTVSQKPPCEPDHDSSPAEAEGLDPVAAPLDAPGRSRVPKLLSKAFGYLSPKR